MEEMEDSEEKQLKWHMGDVSRGIGGMSVKFSFDSKTGDIALFFEGLKNEDVWKH